MSWYHGRLKVAAKVSKLLTEPFLVVFLYSDADLDLLPHQAMAEAELKQTPFKILSRIQSPPHTFVYNYNRAIRTMQLVNTR